ncbi:Uncharacterised protein [Candidatus Gugararchaeum adminiculabundum]|nr:Uncharacterised protein [Candidatus Gugararchaeum adminiculabundum]
MGKKDVTVQKDGSLIEEHGDIQPRVSEVRNPDITNFFLAHAYAPRDSLEWLIRDHREYEELAQSLKKMDEGKNSEGNHSKPGKDPSKPFDVFKMDIICEFARKKADSGETSEALRLFHYAFSKAQATAYSKFTKDSDGEFEVYAKIFLKWVTGAGKSPEDIGQFLDIAQQLALGGTIEDCSSRAGYTFRIAVFRVALGELTMADELFQLALWHAKKLETEEGESDFVKYRLIGEAYQTLVTTALDQLHEKNHLEFLCLALRAVQQMPNHKECRRQKQDAAEQFSSRIRQIENRKISSFGIGKTLASIVLGIALSLFAKSAFAAPVKAVPAPKPKPAPVAQNPAATRWGNPPFRPLGAPGAAVFAGQNGEHSVWFETGPSINKKIGLNVMKGEWGNKMTRTLAEIGLRLGKVGKTQNVDVGVATTQTEKPGKSPATTTRVGLRMAIFRWLTFGVFGGQKEKPTYGFDAQVGKTEDGPINLSLKETCAGKITEIGIDAPLSKIVRAGISLDDNDKVKTNMFLNLGKGVTVRVDWDDVKKSSLRPTRMVVFKGIPIKPINLH